MNAFDALSENDPEHVQRLREKMNLWRPIQTEHCLTQLPRRKAILSVHHLAPWSRELGINPKTVANWRKRATVGDMKTGPTEPRSAVLTKAGEAMVVAFRRPAPLPLDDCLYALQPSIPHLPHLRAVLTVQAHRRPLACRMPPASRHSCALAPAAIPSMLCA